MNSCVVCIPVAFSKIGLPFNLANLERIKDIFDDFKLVAFYDHVPGENSLKTLEEFKEKNIIDTTIIKNTQPRTSQKVINIANARNGCLKEIKEKYSDYEYFIVMDTNDYSCVGDIIPETLQAVLDRKDEWDSVSFHREGGYYDWWALSYDPYIYSMFHMHNWGHHSLMRRTEFGKRLEDSMVEGADFLLPVYSGFNGCAIYKTKKFLDCTYSPYIDMSLFPKDVLDRECAINGRGIWKREETLDCEHRRFHLEAIQKNGARIFVCSKFLFKKLPEEIVKTLPPSRGGEHR